METFEIYANRTKMITASDDGTGALLGTWAVEVGTTTSDRRFKRDVSPLELLFRDRFSANNETLASWFLDKIRPVSFVMDLGDDSVRFGFIAQEIERVLPEIVRTTNGTDSAYSLVYQDLIALLTAVMQEQQKRIEQLEIRLRQNNERISAFERIIEEERNERIRFQKKILDLIRKRKEEDLITS